MHAARRAETRTLETQTWQRLQLTRWAANQAPSHPLDPVTTRRGVSFEVAREMLLAFPGVEEGPCYGTPGFRVRGKFLARLREDGESLAVKCGFDERDFRMQADPVAFFTTDHYRGYPTVLIQLPKVHIADLRAVLEHAWRLRAPKRLVAEYVARRS